MKTISKSVSKNSVIIFHFSAVSIMCFSFSIFSYSMFMNFNVQSYINLLRIKVQVMGVYCTTSRCRLRLSKCTRDVITAAVHSVRTKHRGLASPSEIFCACKAASVIALTCSGSRSSELPFIKCCSILCLLYMLLCNKSELVKNCQL